MSLKQKIRQQELTINTCVAIPHPPIIKILTTAGFEWMAIDIEHALPSTSIRCKR